LQGQPFKEACAHFFLYGMGINKIMRNSLQLLCGGLGSADAQLTVTLTAIRRDDGGAVSLRYLYS